MGVLGAADSGPVEPRDLDEKPEGGAVDTPMASPDPEDDREGVAVWESSPYSSASVSSINSEWRRRAAAEGWRTHIPSSPDDTDGADALGENVASDMMIGWWVGTQDNALHSVG